MLISVVGQMLLNCTTSAKVPHRSSTRMSLPCTLTPSVFDFPTGILKVLTCTGVGVQDHSFIALEDFSGIQECTVVPPKHLFHGVLPAQDSVSGNMTYPLTEMTDNWTSVELQLTVCGLCH